MTRQIDFSQDLSREELIYVAQRPWMAEEAERQGYSGVIRKSQAAFRGDPVETVRRGPVPPVVPDMSLIAVNEEPKDVDPEDSEGVTPLDEDDDPGYEEWTTAELRAEISERGLKAPKTMSNDGLAKILRDDDEL